MVEEQVTDRNIGRFNSQFFVRRHTTFYVDRYRYEYYRSQQFPISWDEANYICNTVRGYLVTSENSAFFNKYLDFHIPAMFIGLQYQVYFKENV